MEVADITPPGIPLSAAPLVLMLDDNAEDIALVREALHERGVAARLMSASHPAQALGLLRLAPHAPLRLAIVDLALPTCSGHAVLRELASHPAWRSVPAIVLTGSENEADRVASLALGAREHVRKPESFDGYLQLVDRLRGYLAPGLSPGQGALMQAQS